MSGTSSLFSDDKRGLRHLMNEVPCGIGVYNYYFDGRLEMVYLNDGYYALLETVRDNRHDYYGFSMTSPIHPEDLAVTMDAIRYGVAKNEPIAVKMRVRCGSGRYKWLSINAKIVSRDEEKVVLYASYADIEKERTTLIELQKEKETVRAILDNVQSGISAVTFDADGKVSFLFVNDRYFDILGYPDREEYFRTVLDPFERVYEEDRDTVKAEVRQVLRTEVPTYSEYRLKQCSGGMIWVRHNISVAHLAGIEAPVVLGVMHNINSQKLAAEALRMSEEQYRLAMEHSRNMLCRYNVADRSVHMTPQVAARFDMPQKVDNVPYEPVRLGNISDDSKEAYISFYESIIHGAASGKELFQARMINGWRWLEGRFSTVFSQDKRPMYAVISFADVTEARERAEAESILQKIGENYYALYLLDTQNDVNTLLKLSTELGAVVHGKQMSWSREFWPIVKEWVTPEYYEELQKLLSREYVATAFKNTTERRELIYQQTTGKWIKIILQPLVVKEAVTLKALATVVDVTAEVKEAKEKNAALAAALEAANQASIAKSQFLSRMSHDLRTPMNAIIGISALAAADVNKPAAMEDAIGKIGISARYLLSLINDILEMSRIESGRLSLNEESFDFEEFIASVNTIVYNQAAAKNVDYDAVVNGFVERSYVGDALKLQQVLVNVLSNAVKFTKPGGKVTFFLEQLQCTNEYATLRFIISDTGCGISPEFFDELFDPFAQENSGNTSTTAGSGLGLAIAKNLVEMMNGHISVQSIKNIGSTFTIDVRLRLPEVSKRYNSGLLASNLQELRALVVDDDVMVCRSTVNILTSMNVQAEWVESGSAAVERVVKAHRDGLKFDTVFIDWKMPDMDGVETTRQIRRIVGPSVTIIIITAYDWHAIEEEALAAGVNYFVEKPLFRASLERTFERVLNDKKENLKDSKKQAKPLSSQYDFGGRRILLAEDHPLNVEVAKRLLERTGAEVVVANNGLEALETFTTAGTAFFDAILMDIRMPVMDGLTAARSIRNLHKPGSKTIPIIAMTANAFDEDVEKSLQSGMNAHLIKPINPKELFSTLQRLIQ